MKTIDDSMIADLADQAAASARRRCNHNLHSASTEPVQRLLNALEPGTYVRPHRHGEAGKWELFVVLAGAASVVTFTDSGRVDERIELDAEGPVRGVEIPQGCWHTVVGRRTGTVLFEVKPGPYVPVADKDFAPWAPAEGEPGAEAFLAWLERASGG